ncbi:MAG: sulfotransferase family protein [Acidimicrobiia bacterium]
MRVRLRRPFVRVGSAIASAERRFTAARRPLPDFLILGAQRAGTSSLYRNLSEHPQVIPAQRKEVHFFDYQYDRGPDWYRARFPLDAQRNAVARGVGGPAVTGEASPSYLFHPLVPPRVAGLLPDAKLVAILRDPVDRAISAYHHLVARGHERRSMEEAFAADESRVVPPPADPAWDRRASELLRFAYLGRGRYAEQLERWHDSFADVLVIETSALTAGPGDGFDRVVAHLGMEPWRPESFTELHRGSYSATEEPVRHRLAEYFAPHNERLFALLGTEFDWTQRS